jgi:hypothetical protein
MITPFFNKEWGHYILIVNNSAIIFFAHEIFL